MKTKIGLLGLVMSFMFIGCHTDDNQGTNAPMSTDDLTTNANLDVMSDDVSKIALDQFAHQSGVFGKSADTPDDFLPACATVTPTVANGTWTRTIDFGTAGCTLNDGNIVKGKIIVSGSVDYAAASYTLSCSFVNFYHNGNLIQGTKTIVRTLASTANLDTVHPVLTMTVDMSITTVNGVVRTMTGTRTREMIAGFDTPKVWSDDVFWISGSQTVVSPKGTITANITVPLVVKLNCSYIVKGVVVYTKDGKTATLDYGDGTCDAFATTTINGITKVVALGV